MDSNDELLNNARIDSAIAEAEAELASGAKPIEARSFFEKLKKSYVCKRLQLVEITESNWLEYAALTVKEDQRGFLDSALGIIARGYAYRSCRARVVGLAEGDTAVGLALVRDLDEEPECYDLQQFMIDRRYQGRGFGEAALKMILARLEAERKYSRVEVCVKRADIPAIRLYEKLGFMDTGYVDPDAPDSVNMTYRF